MTVYNAGKAAAESWKQDYEALRLSYDRSALDASLLAFIKVEMAEDTVAADEDQLYVMLCVAYSKLAQRQAISPVRPFSTEGERQHDDLCRQFRIVPGDLRPEAPQLSLIERVAKDFNEHLVPMSEIKKRRKDPEYESAYVSALEAGLIV